MVAVASPAHGTEEAPAAVAVVRDFVNTSDHELATDELESVEKLSRWLQRAGLADGPGIATVEELGLALRLRAGLRHALEVRAGAPRMPRAR